MSKNSMAIRVMHMVQAVGAVALAAFYYQFILPAWPYAVAAWQGEPALVTPAPKGEDVTTRAPKGDRVLWRGLALPQPAARTPEVAEEATFPVARYAPPVVDNPFEALLNDAPTVRPERHVVPASVLVQMLQMYAHQQSQPLNGSASARERRCLAENLYYEARSEGVEGKLAVAVVTHNRVAVRYNGESTYCGVVWDKQRSKRGLWVAMFSWTLEKRKAPYGSAWRQARYLADVYLGHQQDASVARSIVRLQRKLEGVTLYHADYVTPRDWDFTLLTRVAKIGVHEFYRRLDWQERWAWPSMMLASTE